MLGHLSPHLRFPRVYRVGVNQIGSALPFGPGLYAFFGDSARSDPAFRMIPYCLYFGRSQSLAEEVRRSLNRQSFGNTVYFLPAEPCFALDREARHHLLKELEARCIAAMYTMTWGNRTPVLLTNRQHARVLSETAWSPSPPKDLSFAINVTITILEDIGFPPLWRSLPRFDQLQAHRHLMQKADFPALFEAYQERFRTPFSPIFREAAGSCAEVKDFTQPRPPQQMHGICLSQRGDPGKNTVRSRHNTNNTSMSRIPLIEARFFPEEDTLDRIEMQLIKHLRGLRAGVSMKARQREELALPHEQVDALAAVNVSHLDRIRIQRRAKVLIERRKSATGLAHLGKEDRQRLMSLRHGAVLLSIGTEHRADEIAAALHDEMPWMGPATEHAWHGMRRSVRTGQKGFRLPPLLLDGPPGIGKSYWARRLGELLAAPTLVIEATNENASFGLVGAQRGWGSAEPGRLVQALLLERVGNPVVVVDEVEKSGTARTVSGRAFGLNEALLPLLETLSAKRWSCPYYQVKFDMSWISWVLTSNDCSVLPAPLLSRCPPVRLRALTSSELVDFILREGRKKGVGATALEAAVEAFERAGHQQHPPSLRTAARVIQRAYDLERHPILH